MDDKQISRRELVRVGLVTGAGSALGFALAACATPTPSAVAQSASPSPASSAPAAMASTNPAGDIAILNGAIGLEYQAIWAYKTAAATGLLNGKDAISMAVLAQALQNVADHTIHAATLAAAVASLGGTATAANSTYDLSAYINAGEGNLKDLGSIARLALALEVDAALAYEAAFVSLSSKDLLKAAGTIGPTESAHAAAIRSLLLQAKVITGQVVPAPFVNPTTRAMWVAKV